MLGGTVFLVGNKFQLRLPTVLGSPDSSAGLRARGWSCTREILASAGPGEPVLVLAVVLTFFEPLEPGAPGRGHTINAACSWPGRDSCTSAGSVACNDACHMDAGRVSASDAIESDFRRLFSRATPGPSEWTKFVGAAPTTPGCRLRDHEARCFNPARSRVHELVYKLSLSNQNSVQEHARDRHTSCTVT